MNPPSKPPFAVVDRRYRWRWPLLAIVMAVAAVVVVWRTVSPNKAKSARDQLAVARAAFLAGDFRDAHRLATDLLARIPGSVPALLIAGQSAAKLDRLDEAVQLLERLPDNGDRTAMDGLLLASSFRLQQGRVTDAEDLLRRVLARDSNDLAATAQLARLLSIEGRGWESLPFLHARLKQAGYPLEHLQWVVQPDALLNAGAKSMIEQWHAVAPRDPRPLIGLSKLSLDDNDVATARRFLEQAVSFMPELSEAQARLGSLLLESFPNDFPGWHASLPAVASSHPRIWVVRGHWASHRNDTAASARCFLEAVRRDPNDRAANYQAGQQLVALNRRDLAEPFLRRAGWLDQLRITVESMADEHADAARTAEAARLTEQLGRYWECWGWHQFTLLLQPDSVLAREGLQRVQARISQDLPLTDPASNPSLSLNIEQFPLPGVGSSQPSSATGDHRSQSEIRFTDSTAVSGLVFQYFNDHDPQQSVMRMMEFTGGGIAVLDYDADGWPDLHLTQGCRWPPDPTRKEHSDQLFRNLGQGQFANVTILAGVEEYSYSQGVAVGDYDNDGFPDLYVGNIGGNRLFHNRGDGTFVDATESCGVAGAEWTTSCAFADLDGDGFPDIYAVNYLSGEDVATRICRDAKGVPRSCKPTSLPASSDRVYINRRNGTFEDQTADLGFAVPEGRGLGVVTADFDDSRRLSVFVANDGEANFFFTPRGQTTAATTGQFLEQGVSAGVAFDRNGKPQASMGIAAGDADRDGRLDLLITNFYHEAPTLYGQRQPLLFADITREAGLYDPGFSMLGFGTQFLDADLDGHLDLVVANGHEGDYRDLGIPFQMPPQFFRNLGVGRFAELPADRVGPYFQGKYLGRSVARLDWNRDGRDDFVVSHLDVPLALLTNDSGHTGNSLAVNLRGTVAARDAIGSRVTATSGPISVSAQLTAGDGFQASNHRRLTLGLGSLERVEELTIHWPSGTTQHFRDVAVNREILIIEDRDHPILLSVP